MKSGAYGAGLFTTDDFIRWLSNHIARLYLLNFMLREKTALAKLLSTCLLLGVIVAPPENTTVS